MYPWRKFNNPQNPPRGYMHFWYSGKPDEWHQFTRVSEEQMYVAVQWAEFMAMEIPKPEYWRPVPVPYTNKAYLLDDAVIVHSTIVDPEKRKGLPQEIISILAQKQESIIKMAKKMKLPSIEKLVDASR